MIGPLHSSLGDPISKKKKIVIKNIKMFVKRVVTLMLSKLLIWKGRDFVLF